MIYSVLAHYDPEGVWDPNFITLLEKIVQIADKTIVVTTSPQIGNLPKEFASVKLVSRPNIGYDFYSYRVGIEIAANDSMCKGIILANSSIVVLNSTTFLSTLRLLTHRDNKTSVIGVTRSSQFGDHLQSYLLFFNFNYFSRHSLIHFFRQVEPLNSKLEIILEYEVGLTNFIRARGITYKSLYRPSIVRRLIGYYDYIKACFESDGFKAFFISRIYRFQQDINWIHFGAKDIASRFGFVKSELLQANPHKISQSSILGECSDSLLDQVSSSANRKCRFYSTKPSGLTELEMQVDDMGIIREWIEKKSFHASRHKIAAVVHVYYKGLFEEALGFLSNIIEPLDLYVTTPFERDIPGIIDSCAKYGMPVCILYTRNKGRDIGPFLSLYRSGRLNKYDAVLKIHTKKSTYSSEGSNWRSQLFNSLCGASLVSLKSIMLIRDKSCGIIGPSQFFLTNPKFYGSNQTDLSNILHDCGIANYYSGPPTLAFFAGSMFWFSPKALAAINHCKERSLCFQPENGMQDGTLAHAWERAFCLIAKDAGYEISSINHYGKSILDDSDTIFNNVPVL
jgi:rhamnosyltransferase